MINIGYFLILLLIFTLFTDQYYKDKIPNFTIKNKAYHKVELEINFSYLFLIILLF